MDSTVQWQTDRCHLLGHYCEVTDCMVQWRKVWWSDKQHAALTESTVPVRTAQCTERQYGAVSYGMVQFVRILQWMTGSGHKEISLAPSTSQTKCAVQQGKVCWHGVLDCGLGPSLVKRTGKKINSLKFRRKLRLWSREQSSSRFHSPSGWRALRKMKWMLNVNNNTLCLLVPILDNFFLRF